MVISKLLLLIITSSVIGDEIYFFLPDYIGNSQLHCVITAHVFPS